MSIEELLKPRIICYEDYLNNKFEVGKQIPLVWKKEFNDWAYEDCSVIILLSTFLKYKQFKKLEWWQGRSIDEMPREKVTELEAVSIKTIDFLQIENEKLCEALDKIVSPIKFFQEDAEKEGYHLNGMMAVQLSKDPNYLQEIAKKARGEFQSKCEEFKNKMSGTPHSEPAAQESDTTNDK